MTTPEPEPLDEPARRKIVSSVLAVMVLGALDQTIVATAMPTIGAALGNFERLPWIVTTYLVASTVATPLYGKLSDIHGRRPVLLVSVAIFVVGSVVCALAPTMTTLIIARAIQGFGGGGIMSIPQTIIADIIPPNQRGRYQALFATGFAAALIAGPLLGGFFASQLHWSLIFWINLPIVTVALALMRAPLRRLPLHHRPHRLDILGALLMAAATVTLLLALDRGSAQYGRPSASVMLLVAASAALWIGFGVRNLRAPEPLLPFAVLKDQVVATATAASFFGLASFVGLTIVVPIFLQFSLRLSAGESALAFLVLTLGTVVGSWITGRLMTRWRRYRLIGAIGLGIATLALVLLALLASRLPLAAFEILLGLAGVGIGTAFPLGTVAVQSAVAVHHLGIATAALGFVRSLGGAIGAATLGAIALGGAAAGNRALHEAPMDVDATFATVFAGAAVFAGLAAICFWAMEDRPLRATVAHAPADVNPRDTL